MSMILLEPANKITHLQGGDQAADHLINGVLTNFDLGSAARLRTCSKPPDSAGTYFPGNHFLRIWHESGDRETAVANDALGAL
jgi:hypothetical protein